MHASMEAKHPYTQNKINEYICIYNKIFGKEKEKEGEEEEEREEKEAV